jgi:predicted nucleic acid-binding protein
VNVLLDAFALVALLRDEPAAAEVEALLRRGSTGMPAINLAEALDVLERVEGVPRSRLDELTGPLVAESIDLLAVDERLARAGASLRARYFHRSRSPLSLADCILLGAAAGASLATADPPLARAARSEQIVVHALADSRGRRP